MNNAIAITITRLLAGLTVIGILVLAPACAKYQPRPISAERNADAFAARRLDDPDLKKFLEQNIGHELAPWPMRAWPRSRTD